MAKKELSIDPGYGLLFQNFSKDNDKQPDWTGDANYEGTRIEIAGWLKDGPKGKYLSLAVKEKKAKAPAQQPQTEDVPF